MSKIILLSFLLLIVQLTKGQILEVENILPNQIKKGTDLRFDEVTIAHESFKKSEEKWVTFQDKMGYLWLQYEGDYLLRYDGNYFKEFEGKNWKIAETETGQIVGKNGDRFVIYDEKTESFIKYKSPLIELNNSKINHITITPKNESYVFQEADEETIVPIKYFNYRSKTSKVITPKAIKNGYNTKESFKFKNFWHTFYSSKGLLWGIFNNNGANEPIFGYYNPKTLECFGYPLFIKTPNNDGNVLESTWNMVEDGKYIWMTNTWYQLGLLRFDTEKKQWNQYKLPEAGLNIIKSLSKDIKGNFLLKTDAGLSVFNPNNKSYTIHRNDPLNKFSLPKNETGFYSKNKSDYWFRIANRPNNDKLALLMLDKQYFKKSQYLESNRFETKIVYKDINRVIYSNIENGIVTLTEYNFSTKQNKTLWQYDQKGVSFQHIRSAIYDTINHKLMFFGNALKNGLLQMKDGGSKLSLVKAAIEGLVPPNNKIENINTFRVNCKDKDGNIWMAHGNLLVKYEAKKNKFEGYSPEKNGLKNQEAFGLEAAQDGTIWIGYRSGDLVWFDPKTKKALAQKEFKPLFSGDIPKLLYDKKRNVMWISRSSYGLWQYDFNTKKYKKIPEIPELIHMHLTKDGVLWIKTFQNIIRYDPETRYCMNFGPEYDINESFAWTPFTKTYDDELCYGNKRFDANDIKPDTTKPRAVFSNINVFDKLLPTIENLNLTKDIKLNHSQNFFSIGFSVLSYFQKEQNQYAYKLEGFNKDWINVGNRPIASFTNVPPGSYILKIKGSNNDAIWSNERSLTIIIKPAYWQTWWFKLLGLLTFLALVYIVYRYNLNQKQLKLKLAAEVAHGKQLEAEFQSKLTQTEVKALRAQMNPHFIFNCLNSIEFFTANNQPDLASEYLTKFSRLIRLVLENSRSEKVSLENELDTLKLYLDMEAMRFKGKVKYKINIAKNIEVEAIEIPPLLIQPFVENAIWHGLMQKDDGGLVKIEVNKPQENLLHIEIIDNGIGRAKAAEFKSKSATKNKSFGMKVTTERIELINQMYKTNTKIEIIDLYNSKNEPNGTKIIVEIPI